MASGVLDRWRPAPGGWDRAAATHLLRRAGFGAGPERVRRALDEGFEETLRSILADDEHDPRRLAAIRPLLAAGNPDDLRAWWMSLLFDGRAALRERITLMWHGHFATSNAKVDDVRLMHRQSSLLRSKGMGDFRELFHALARDPAMLVWLDGNRNRKGAANENFAREVMELFGLGIGEYTEEDVAEAARAFTGWGTEGRSFVLRERDHDGGAKRIFGKSGRFGGDEVIDLILEHPACARHIARRLLVELVHPAPRPEWIAETADLLRANEWDVGATVGRILASRLFFSPQARRSRIAAPVELIAIAVRTLGARVYPREAARRAARMGQTLFRPPSVKGWDGMKAWINAGAWVARHNALIELVRLHGEKSAKGELDLRAAFPEASSIERAARAVAETLVPDVRDEGYAAALESAARGAGDLDEALVLVTGLVLSSPEFHLM